MFAVRYCDDVGLDESLTWRAVVLKKCDFKVDIDSTEDDAVLDLLGAVQRDDTFHECFPVLKVFWKSPSQVVDVSNIKKKELLVLTGSDGGAGDGTFRVDVRVRRQHGSPSSFVSVWSCSGEGGVSLQSKGRFQQVRRLDASLGGFVKVDTFASPSIVEGEFMIECRPSVQEEGVSKETSKHFRYTPLVDTAVFDKHHVLSVQHHEEPSNTRWAQRPLPQDHRQFRDQATSWKGHIREGIPHILRWILWPRLVYDIDAGRSQSNFDSAQLHTFGCVPSELFSPRYPPHFGAFYVETLQTSLSLLPGGWRYLNIILSCLGNLNPDIGLSCPMVPAITSTLLMVVEPHEAFSVLATLIAKSRSPDSTLKPTIYLPLTSEAVSSFVRRTMEVCDSRLSHGLKDDVLYEMIRQTCFTMFIRAFPLVFVLRIMDAYFSEGIKVLVRVFVATLSVYRSHLSKLQDPLRFLAGGSEAEGSLFNICTVDSFHAIMKAAFGLQLSRSELSLSGAVDHFVTNTTECVQVWPILDTASTTLGTDLSVRERIFLWLPGLFKSLKLCYRASQNGFSLTKLYDCCKFRTEGQCLVIWLLEGGNRFGAFTSIMPSQPHRTYQGKRQDFLFAIRKDPTNHDELTFTQYRSTGIDTNYVLPESTFLTFGSGPAARIVSDLHTARSNRCQTYGCQPLWEEEGQITDLEVFAIS